MSMIFLILNFSEKHVEYKHFQHLTRFIRRFCSRIDVLWVCQNPEWHVLGS